MENVEGVKNTCGCKCHKVFPLLIVLFGLTFLLGALNVLSASAVGIIWPILVILAGLKKWMGKSCKCC